jgi:hypothetical protein
MKYPATQTITCNNRPAAQCTHPPFPHPSDQRWSRIQTSPHSRLCWRLDLGHNPFTRTFMILNFCLQMLNFSYWIIMWTDWEFSKSHMVPRLTSCGGKDMSNNVNNVNNVMKFWSSSHHPAHIINILVPIHMMKMALIMGSHDVSHFGWDFRDTSFHSIFQSFVFHELEAFYQLHRSATRR